MTHPSRVKTLMQSTACTKTNNRVSSAVAMSTNSQSPLTRNKPVPPSALQLTGTLKRPIASQIMGHKPKMLTSNDRVKCSHNRFLLNSLITTHTCRFQNRTRNSSRPWQKLLMRLKLNPVKSMMSLKLGRVSRSPTPKLTTKSREAIKSSKVTISRSMRLSLKDQWLLKWKPSK